MSNSIGERVSGVEFEHTHHTIARKRGVEDSCK
jgi:hypothetical protein